MRRDIGFRSGGLDCRGWLYTPDAAPAEAPVIVMAHGLGGVKDQALPACAERFARGGYAVVVFDYRYFGDSAGEPRGQILALRHGLDRRAARSGP